MKLPALRRSLARWKKARARATKLITLRRKQIKAAKAAQVQHATGVDVSAMQGLVDFAKVKASGRAFVYCKATEGQDFTDVRFAANIGGARAAGLKVGAYHFLRPRAGRTGAVEAAWFVRHLQAVKLGKGDLRPVLDVEATTLGPAATMTYVGEAVTALRKAGYEPVIYTFPLFEHWTSTFGCPLWIANPDVKAPTVPAPWKGYAIWQTSFKGRVPGINADVDLDTTPDLRSLIA